MKTRRKIFLFPLFFLLAAAALVVFGLPVFSFGGALKVCRADNSSSTLPTLVNVLSVCGDGWTDPGVEVCDPGNSRVAADFGTTTCQSFVDPHTSVPYVSGHLDCLNDCGLLSHDSCYTCGDNAKEGLEECDGIDFGGATDCTSYGYTTGTISCTYNCRIDLSLCSIISTSSIPGGQPTTGGGGGNSGGQIGFLPGTKIAPDQTVVIIKGKAYPNSEVRVLIDGRVVGIIKADSKSDFRFETGDVTPGIISFGLWTEDDRGLKSTLLTLTFRVASKSITTINNVYLSPTIDADKQKVNKGNVIKFFGKSSPDVNVQINVNSLVERIASTSASGSGNWTLSFDTKDLEEDMHTARAMIHLKSPEGIIESNFSRTVSFYVGKDIVEEGNCGKADLNCDGFVNLVDFSILLYNWGTAEKTSDINADGSVGLIDFSIMMFYWTG